MNSPPGDTTARLGCNPNRALGKTSTAQRISPGASCCKGAHIDFDAIRQAHSVEQFCDLRGIVLRRNGSSGSLVGLCPFHEEEKPSFTVYSDHAHCFGCGWHGDVIDLCARLDGLQLAEAVKKLSEPFLNGGASHILNSRVTQKLSPPSQQPICLPALEKPNREDIQLLSQSRSIAPVPLEIGADRGLWFSFDDELNGRCWVYTDRTRRCAIRRRIDNRPFRLKDGTEPKTAAVARSDMSVPLGYQEAKPFPYIGIVEGGPNALAVIAHAWASCLERRVAPVCMPCTNANFSEEALDCLQGKRARIFVHDDGPGTTAAYRWAKQLKAANVDVDGYSFDGLFQIGGLPVKDLNDLCRVDADCWEANREVIESVMDFAV